MSYPFKLPELGYDYDALEPHISAETLNYHHDKHHAAYVNNLNNLIPGTEFENASLEEIVMKSDGGVFNNAAQVWNHTFYWHCLSPNGGGEPTGELKEAIERDFPNFSYHVALSEPLPLGEDTYRITASVGVGSSGIINIERQAELSGSYHNTNPNGTVIATEDFRCIKKEHFVHYSAIECRGQHPAAAFDKTQLPVREQSQQHKHKIDRYLGQKQRLQKMTKHWIVGPLSIASHGLPVFAHDQAQEAPHAPQLLDLAP